jgi:hypothetical protein
VEVSIRQKKVAATLEAANLDAYFHFPAAALRLLQAAADTLAEADPHGAVFMPRMWAYVFGVCPLLLVRLLQNADKYDWEESPYVPQPGLWFPDWLAAFDRTVARLSAEYLVNWVPPPTTGRKPKHAGQVVSDVVVEDRRRLRDTWASLREAEETLKGFERTHDTLKSPWSDRSFCLDHKINEREFYYWLKGEKPDVSVTSQRIWRAFTADLGRMRLDGIKALIAATPVMRIGDGEDEADGDDGR